MHPTLSSRTVASLPAYLNGAEGFKTAQEDRGVTGGLVSFSLIETANVYVCWDASCSTSWLTGGGWTQMPELVQISGDPGAPTRQIWRKRFDAGAVDLQGPNCGSGNNMFVLVTEAAPEITAITLSGGDVTITWTGGGTLYSSPSLSPASWTTTGDSDGSYTAPAGTGNRFFRVER